MACAMTYKIEKKSPKTDWIVIHTGMGYPEMVLADIAIQYDSVRASGRSRTQIATHIKKNSRETGRGYLHITVCNFTEDGDPGETIVNRAVPDI